MTASRSRTQVGAVAVLTAMLIGLGITCRQETTVSFRKSCNAWSCERPLATSQSPEWPKPRPELHGDTLNRWTRLHESHVEEAARQGSTAKLVFLGDSITEGWLRTGFSARSRSLAQPACKSIWDASFGKWQPLNFGIGGDRVQDLGWRLQHGLFPPGLQPEALVVAIGTNDLGNGESASVVLAELKTLLLWLHAMRPTASIMLVGILPRGADVGTPRTTVFHRSAWWMEAWNPYYTAVQRINRGIAAFSGHGANRSWLRYVDCSHTLLARAHQPADQLRPDKDTGPPGSGNGQPHGAIMEGHSTKGREDAPAANRQPQPHLFIDGWMSYDLLHLTPRGYALFARCLRSHLDIILS